MGSSETSEWRSASETRCSKIPRRPRRHPWRAAGCSQPIWRSDQSCLLLIRNLPSPALWFESPTASAAPALSATSLLIASERSIGAMPQLVQGKSRSTGTKRRRPLNRRGDLSKCLDALAGDIDSAEQDLLAVQKAKQVERHLGAGTFDRDLIDPARREGREDRLVRPPFRPEARLPVNIGFDAVAKRIWTAVLQAGLRRRGVALRSPIPSLPPFRR